MGTVENPVKEESTESVSIVLVGSTFFPLPASNPNPFPLFTASAVVAHVVATAAVCGKAAMD
jgi:hypothetical protein